MKLVDYASLEPTRFDNEVAKGIAGRVAIGKNDGAENFCMRVFEVAPGGHTPRHSHAWEHEMFYHRGSGEVFYGGEWKPVKPGTVAFIPANQEHQIRNTGTETLVLVCLVPPQAPEL